MNKIDLAGRLARQLHRSRAKAADEVDKLVYKLMKERKRFTEKVCSQVLDRSIKPSPSKDTP